MQNTQITYTVTHTSKREPDVEVEEEFTSRKEALARYKEVQYQPFAELVEHEGDVEKTVLVSQHSF